MNPVNVNGIILTEEVLKEFLYFQTGGSVENTDANGGLVLKVKSVDHVTHFLIDISEQFDDDLKQDSGFKFDIEKDHFSLKFKWMLKEK